MLSISIPAPSQSEIIELQREAIELINFKYYTASLEGHRRGQRRPELASCAKLLIKYHKN